jgi:FemAB-related protein (PEP-CTERM system-associated)
LPGRAIVTRRLKLILKKCRTAMPVLESAVPFTSSRPLEFRTQTHAPCICGEIDFERRDDTLDYDSFVEQHPSATLFHGLAWKQAVEKTFEHRPFYLIARRGTRVRGVLPLFQINSMLTGRFMVSVPYATYGGVLAIDDEARSGLLEYAKDLAIRRRCQALELRSMHAADPDVSVKTSHATFIRDLPSDSQEIEEFLPRKARASARNAADRSKLHAVFDSTLLHDVWRLYARSMRRLGSPNYPLAFFESIRDALGERMMVQLVRSAGEPVAGLISFIHRNTLMPYFAGVDDRKKIHGLSHFLHREAMRRAVILGLKTYDFGRSRIDNTGAYEFKRLCGFVPQELEYQTYVVPGSHAPDLAANSPRWSLARRCWKMLPLSIARPLGGRLARAIPG